MKLAFLLLIIISALSYGQTKYDQHDELISAARSLRKDGKL